MTRIVSYLALLGLLVSVVCAAPAKKSEDTDQAEETKQISQQTKGTSFSNTAEETSKSEDKSTNQEVTRYQDIQVDNDSKVTSENEPDKRARTPQVQKVAEHILTQNEAITLVSELTDQDYIEQYLYNEGAQGLFEALDLLKDQGWITDIEYTIISDSIYQQMLAGVPYEIPYESASYGESEQVAQPVYTNTFSSYMDSEQQVDTRLASVVGSLLDRISDKEMTAEEGAAIIGAMIKLLYGLEQPEAAAYSDWEEPEQFLDLPNIKGYKQDFDIVNGAGEPIGKAEEIMETYKTDNGELGQELAALEKMQGKIGENGVFQGEQQTYEKEAVIPLSPVMGEETFEEELGSGSEDDANFLDMVENYMNLGNGDRFDDMLRKIGKIRK